MITKQGEKCQSRRYVGTPTKASGLEGTKYFTFSLTYFASNPARSASARFSQQKRESFSGAGKKIPRKA